VNASAEIVVLGAHVLVLPGARDLAPALEIERLSVSKSERRAGLDHVAVPKSERRARLDRVAVLKRERCADSHVRGNGAMDSALFVSVPKSALKRTAHTANGAVRNVRKRRSVLEKHAAMTAGPMICPLLLHRAMRSALNCESKNVRIARLCVQKGRKSGNAASESAKNVASESVNSARERARSAPRWSGFLHFGTMTANVASESAKSVLGATKKIVNVNVVDNSSGIEKIEKRDNVSSVRTLSAWLMRDDVNNNVMMTCVANSSNSSSIAPIPSRSVACNSSVLSWIVSVAN